MRRKSILVAGLICLSCLFGVCGCQQGGDTGSTDGQTPSVETETGSSGSQEQDTIADADPAANGQAIVDLCQFMLETNPAPSYGSVGGEWTIYDLAKAEVTMPEGYKEGYYETVEVALRESQGVLSDRKYTEYSRLILTLHTLGYDVTDVAGYNLIEKISDFDSVTAQGCNGSIWALIAIDSTGYEFMQSEQYERSSTRELLIQDIMDAEIETGGWGFLEGEADVDLTAMAITALAPYAEDETVATAIDAGVQYLSQMQGESGAYETYGTASSETCGQVVMALSTLGIDADTDKRFVKNGVSLYDALMSFQLEDGSFCHVKAEGMDYLATEQVGYCLLAYEQFLQGR